MLIGDHMSVNDSVMASLAWYRHDIPEKQSKLEYLMPSLLATLGNSMLSLLAFLSIS
jgi:hypothetical protein